MSAAQPIDWAPESLEPGYRSEPGERRPADRIAKGYRSDPWILLRDARDDIAEAWGCAAILLAWLRFAKRDPWVQEDEPAERRVLGAILAGVAPAAEVRALDFDVFTGPRRDLYTVARAALSLAPWSRTAPPAGCS